MTTTTATPTAATLTQDDVDETYPALRELTEYGQAVSRARYQLAQVTATMTSARLPLAVQRLAAEIATVAQQLEHASEMAKAAARTVSLILPSLPELQVAVREARLGSADAATVLHDYLLQQQGLLDQAAPAAPAMPSHGVKDRDKYGRTIVRVIGTDRHQLGSIVLLPQQARDKGMYLTNDWRVQGPSSVRYHATRREALLRFDLTAAQVD